MDTQKSPLAPHFSAAELLIGKKIALSRWIVILCSFSLGLLVAGLLLLDRNLENKILPNTSIDGVAIGGLSFDEAETLLADSQEAVVPNTAITLSVDDIFVSSSSAELALRHNTAYVLEIAALHGKESSFLTRMIQLTRSLFIPTKLTTNLEIPQEQRTALIEQLAKKVDIQGQEPAATLRYSGTPSSLTIFAGSIGREISLEETDTLLSHAISTQDFSVEASVASTSATLSDEEVATFREKALSYVGTQLVGTFNKDTTVRLSDTEVISLLRFPEAIDTKKAQETIKKWSDEIYREPQNAVFEYSENEKEVTTFVPDRNGRALNQQETLTLVTEKILSIPAEESDEVSFELPITTVEPATTLESTNGFGITERIGFGESYYDHSIPTRINNVGVTSKKINNILVAPGEEFSFNKALGEVSAATGFKPAYVISNGKTELGDGGGVCQVSSTLFRALLDSGLHISLRLPHSYRVGYYELNSDPGFDATVYSGNVDLRFINDTDHYVLIHTTNDPENLHLVMELYGTSDGRTTEISDYQKWGFSPALPTEYIEDPSLPAGTKKQVDWAVSGLKTKFTHTVKDAEGNVMREKTYTSNYRPWSAKYLVGIEQ